MSQCKLCIVCKTYPGIIKDKNKKWFYCNECFIEINYTKCPKCGHCVEKNGGCSQIECICGIEFCYYCGEKSSRHESCSSCTICEIEFCCKYCVNCCTNDCINRKKCKICKKIRKICKCVVMGPFKFSPYNKSEHPMQLRKR